MTAKRLCIATASAFLGASFAVTQCVLPKPKEAFQDAKIGRTYKDSKPGTIALAKAPARAPNVLVILSDDAGFGAWGTLGGQAPTPNLTSDPRKIRGTAAAMPIECPQSNHPIVLSGRRDSSRIRPASAQPVLRSTR
jgi:hypothetical protein